jgi:hypothetical protein
MQPSLFDAATSPLPARRGYVPCLQDHAGELLALTSLRADAAAALDDLTPVIQVVGGNKRQLSRDAIKGHIGRIAGALGTDRQFYLDFLRADPARTLSVRGGEAPVAEVAYRYARRRGLSFVPVSWTTSRAGHVNAAANAAVVDRRGLALRHRVLRSTSAAGAPIEEVLGARLADLRLPPEDVDLLLDLEYLDEDIELPPERMVRLIVAARSVGSWRRVVVTGSSIPKTMGCVPEDGSRLLERREWALWLTMPAEVRDGLDFGDHGIQHPTPPKDGGPGMRANIRYTLADGHLVVRGRGDVRVEGAAQYAELCRRLVASGHFAGRSYTWGDELIQRCANQEIPPGDQTMWRAAGTAHHLRLVSEQVQAPR